jgi:ribosomal protein L11 methyltransferase
VKARGPRALWRISVETHAEAEEAIAELLLQLFGQPASSWTHVETRVAKVSAYFEARPDWSAGKRPELAAGIAELQRFGLEVGRGKFALGKVRKEDWAESWKRHFKPFEIGGKLLIKPSWSKKRPRKGQPVLVLDPGLSFGTGHHPTTSFCLRQLVARRRPGTKQSLLDIGTGSGILALAAAKIGYAPADGFDNDPEAVRISKANARRNALTKKTKFWRGDLSRKSRRQYSVVCANVTADLLVQYRKSIAGCVAPGGRLVLAGILATEFGMVQRAYRNIGWKLVLGRTEKEWRGGEFKSSKNQDPSSR